MDFFKHGPKTFPQKSFQTSRSKWSATTLDYERLTSKEDGRKEPQLDPGTRRRGFSKGEVPENAAPIQAGRVRAPNCTFDLFN